MAPHKFHSPSISLLRIKYLLELVKQKLITAVSTVYIFNKDVEVDFKWYGTVFKCSQMSFYVIIEYNMPQWSGTKYYVYRDDLSRENEAGPWDIFRKLGFILK